MAKFYAKRINYDITRIDEVPAHWREAVRAIIEERNKPLEAMTKAELLALASERGVEAYESWTKAEITAALGGGE